MCMILFYLPNFNGGWLVGWLGSVVKVVESAVIWLLTGFGVRGLRERKKNTKSASMAMCYVYVRGFISLNFNFFAFFLLFLAEFFVFSFCLM